MNMKEKIQMFFSTNGYLHIQDVVEWNVVGFVDGMTGVNATLDSCMFP